MGGENPGVTGPDLAAGIAVAGVPEGKPVAGHVGEDAVLLARRGSEWFAIGAVCTHYHGPLPEGLIVGDTVRCPWHHACFSLSTGEALRAPALAPIPCWYVERVGDMVYVRDKRAAPVPRREASGGPKNELSSVVIVGGGAAGLAAADMLRREGYQGALTILSADDSA